MDRGSTITRTGRTAQLAAAILLTLVMPLGLYLLAAWTAAGVDGSSLAKVPCFEPDKVELASAIRLATAAVMALSAVGFLFVVPGLLGTLALRRLAGIRPTAHVWSLAVNSAALIMLCLLLRHTWGIHRVSLAVAWLGWTALLLGWAWRSGPFWSHLNEWRRRFGSGLLVGLLTTLAAITMFFPEQFLQCFNEDGIETYELARSLRHHFLPYWELETWQPIPGGRMGTVVVNPSLVNSYWTCGLQTLLGDGELATRLPYWVWWTAIFAVSYRLVRRKQQTWLAAVPLALSMLLVTVLFTFYVGYNPYAADLANPGVVDALFTLFVLLAFDCLRQNDRWGWVISITLASLVLYAGALLLMVTLISAWWWKPIERRETLRWGFWGAGMLAAVVVFYLIVGCVDGSLPYWVDTIDIEYVNDYLGDVPRWKSGPLFAGYFLVGCGGLTALGLVRAFRQGAWERTVATATLLYLLVVLCSGFKNLHYLGPLLPIPVILFLLAHKRLLPEGAVGPGGYASAYRNCRNRKALLTSRSDMLKHNLRDYLPVTISVIACIVICWPAARQTFTLNRQLGTRTTIATDSYLTAVQWARLRYTMREQGVMSWDCDQHTWVAYAELDPELKNTRPLVLSDGGPPTPAYQPVAQRQTAETRAVTTLYGCDDKWTQWLSAADPLRPLDRYPVIFIPLADGAFSPHNNVLEDVQRLRWPW